MTLLQEIHSDSHQHTLIEATINANVALLAQAVKVTELELVEGVSQWIANDLSKHLQAIQSGVPVNQKPKAQILAALQALVDPQKAAAYQTAIGKYIEQNFNMSLVDVLNLNDHSQLEKVLGAIGSTPILQDKVNEMEGLLNSNPDGVKQKVQQLRMAIEKLSTAGQQQQQQQQQRSQEQQPIVTKRSQPQQQQQPQQQSQPQMS